MEVANILAEQNRIKYLAEWSRIKNHEPGTFAKILVFWGSKVSEILLCFVYTLVAQLWPNVLDEKHIIVINPCTTEFATQLADDERRIEDLLWGYVILLGTKTRFAPSYTYSH